MALRARPGLAPRLRLTGDMDSLGAFRDYLGGKKLAKGTALCLLWTPDGALEVAASTGDRAPASFAAPDAADLRIESAGLARALFEVYLGSAPASPGARTAWAAGARALLATETVKRDTRKGGGKGT